MELIRQFGLEGAVRAKGPTVVVDTFRAFTTCAFAFARGADRVILAEDPDEARAIAATIPHAVLGGEVESVKPKDFDVGNSPAEMTTLDLDGRVLVHRTSAGTRCVRAAVDAGAAPVWAASLVVADATWIAIRPYGRVTVVPSGRYGVDPAAEDEAVLEYLRSRRDDTADLETLLTRLRITASAERLATAKWAHPNDLALCLDADRFDFAMRVIETDGLVELQPTV